VLFRVIAYLDEWWWDKRERTQNAHKDVQSTRRDAGENGTCGAVSCERCRVRGEWYRDVCEPVAVDAARALGFVT